ncbi:MAG: hypothetical protein IJO46_12055, partial [Thermoguttaceae bacterium]|nr:hypothetical protein [Thermoguttaceae bacterium]
LAELENGVRLVPCPADFLNALRSEVLRLRREKTLENAKTVANLWCAAIAQRDDDATLRYLNIWRKALNECARLNFSFPQNLLDSVRESQAFAEQLARQNAAHAESERKLSRLNNLLEEDESADELNDALEEVERAADAAQVAIPVEIAAECVSRVASAELQKRRTLTLVVSVCVLLCLLVAVAFSFVARRSYWQREAQEVAAELRTQLDRFEGSANLPSQHVALQEAEKIVETRAQASQVAANEDVKKQLQRFETLQSLENERKKRFDEDVAALQKAHEEATSRPHLLQRLKETARTEDEKNCYLDLKSRDDEIRRAETNVNDKEYLKLLNAAVARHKELESNATLNAASLAAEIESIRADLQALDLQFANLPVSQRLTETRATLGDALEQLASETQTRLDLENASATLKTAVGNSTRFQSSLNTLRGQIPDESLTEAQQGLALIPAFNAWNDFVQNSAADQDKWTESGASFVRLETSLTPAFQKLNDFLPELPAVQERLKTLRGLASDGSQFLGRQELAQLLKRSFQNYKPELYLFVYNKGEFYYYLTSLPQNVKEKKPVSYCVDVVNGEAKTESFDLTRIKAQDYASIGLSLQSQLYQKIQALPSAPSGEVWRAFVEDAVTSIVEADEMVLDPAAKVILLKRLLSVICRDPDFQVFAEWNALLAGIDVDVNIYKSSRTLRNFREKAVALLAEIEKLARKSMQPGMSNAASPYLALARQQRQERAQNAAPLPCLWVGYIDVVNRAAQLATSEQIELEDGTLYIADFTDSSAKPQVCGRVQNGVASLNGGFLGKRWSLVFLRPNDAKPSPAP